MSCSDNDMPMGRDAAIESVDLSQSLRFCMVDVYAWMIRSVSKFKQLSFEIRKNMEQGTSKDARTKSVLIQKRSWKAQI
jgi:hypothetical protein